MAWAREWGADLSWHLPGHSQGGVWSQRQGNTRQARFEGGGRSGTGITVINVKLVFFSVVFFPVCPPKKKLLQQVP